jgi:LDH2 family malate/lactate/ureidoglycolate dehydrogenase
VTDALRYRLDDLRRFAGDLGTAAGLARPGAVALAAHLLWYDAAGITASGIESLPGWLERLDRRAVEPITSGAVVSETLGTAVVDGRNGIGPLVLAAAGELAVQKARDAGVGLVRVANLGLAGPAAAIAAEMAVGPMIAMMLGPGPAWTLALPSDEGLPAVFDSALQAEPARGKKDGRPARPNPCDLAAPWAAAVVPEGGWLVMATAVKALESLAALQERVGAGMKGLDSAPGRLLPASWESARRAAREQGVAIAPAAWKRLKDWASRLGVAPPPAATSSPPPTPAPSGAA